MFILVDVFLLLMWSLCLDFVVFCDDRIVVDGGGEMIGGDVMMSNDFWVLLWCNFDGCVGDCCCVCDVFGLIVDMVDDSICDVLWRVGISFDMCLSSFFVFWVYEWFFDWFCVSIVDVLLDFNVCDCDWVCGRDFNVVFWGSFGLWVSDCCDCFELDLLLYFICGGVINGSDCCFFCECVLVVDWICESWFDVFLGYCFNKFLDDFCGVFCEFGWLLEIVCEGVFDEFDWLMMNICVLLSDLDWVCDMLLFFVGKKIWWNVK